MEKISLYGKVFKVPPQMNDAKVCSNGQLLSEKNEIGLHVVAEIDLTYE